MKILNTSCTLYSSQKVRDNIMLRSTIITEKCFRSADFGYETYWRGGEIFINREKCLFLQIQQRKALGDLPASNWLAFGI